MIVATPLLATFMFLSVLAVADPVRAEPRQSDEVADRAYDPSLEIKPDLDAADEIAALDAVRVALTEAGDGSTYVWQRNHGRLNGAVRLTNTFRDGEGRFCRHIVMSLTAGRYSRRTEGIACRGDDRVWSLDG